MIHENVPRGTANDRTDLMMRNPAVVGGGMVVLLAIGFALGFPVG